jgi:hypothetical protein
VGREIASKTFIQVLNFYFAVGKGLFYLAFPGFIKAT